MPLLELLVSTVTWAAKPLATRFTRMVETRPRLDRSLTKIGELKAKLKAKIEGVKYEKLADDVAEKDGTLILSEAIITLQHISKVGRLATNTLLSKLLKLPYFFLRAENGY